MSDERAHGAERRDPAEISIDGIVNRMRWDPNQQADLDLLLDREWLLTNGLGGYASGSVSGASTRRYHGLLVAALPAPYGRMVMLNHLSEEVRLTDGSYVPLGGWEVARGTLELHGAGALREFRLEAGLPVWRYETDAFVLEKRLVMPHLQNTMHISYRLARGDGPLRLNLRPSLHFRPHEARVDTPLHDPYCISAMGRRIEVHPHDPELMPLRMMLLGGRGHRAGAMVLDGGRFRELFYRVEHSRGYEAIGTLWSPGYFRAELTCGEEATLVASTDEWSAVTAMTPDAALASERERRRRLVCAAHPAAQHGAAAELVLAADQFIIQPSTRLGDAARAHAAGDDVRTIIAGYHWFTDWGRDTMISLEGLTLCTGRQLEAGYILRTFSHYIRDGLIPNMFPEGESEGLYHTADATLWFFHAVHRYVGATDDRETLRALIPKLIEIVEHHLKGTRFGIGVDPEDGLLRQGQAGYQLTWMDAKVDDWVVTPRRGKAVELNALWYNALKLLEGWVRDERGDAAARWLADQAERTRASFNRRFWFEQGQYLLDLVDGEDGDDPAIRPNQVFAVALEHPVLDPSRWEAVVNCALQHLVTPVGLRSLARGHRDYKPRYFGDLRSRDAAYHQGTVWGWLVGPMVDAWLRVWPEDKAGARAFVEGFLPHLGEACIGSLSEIFDAEPPFSPRGCVAQAWSVAEALRCWIKTQS